MPRTICVSSTTQTDLWLFRGLFWSSRRVIFQRTDIADENKGNVFSFLFFFSFLLLIRIFSRSSGHYYLKSVRNLSECRKNATLNTTVSRYKRSNRNGNSKKSKVIIDSKYSRYCWKLLFQIKTKLGFYAMAFSKEPRSRVA